MGQDSDTIWKIFFTAIRSRSIIWKCSFCRG